MINFFKHLFIPHKDNDYKPHILREFFVAVFLFIVFFIFIGSVTFKDILSKGGLLAAIYSGVIVDLTNDSRDENNLKPLQMNDLLTQAATAKARDMVYKGYFAHNSPEGVSPWFWIKQSGYDFEYAGENLAIDFSDSEDVEEAWMRSPTHRANILNGHFTDIGIGIAKGMYQGKETVFVVQMLGSRKKSEIKLDNGQNAPQNVEVRGSGLISRNNDVATEEKNEPELENFIEVKNVKGEFVEQKPTHQESWVDSSFNFDSLYKKIFGNPFKTSNTILLSVAALLAVSLCLFIFIERKKQHPKNIAYGVLLLVIIFSAIYINSLIFFSEVMVL